MANKAVTAVHQRYRNKAGVVVPGVTTVIGLLAKPALINWAWRLGLEGQDFNKVRDKAANIGTITHYMCECVLKGEEPDMSEFCEADINVATPMYNSFKKWFKSNRLVLVGSEVGVVSEAWQFGGTIDLIALDDGVLTLFDIKTSKGVYDEYKIQLSAYKEAWDEAHPDRKIEVIKVVHLDKETGDLSIHTYSDLKREFKIFTLLRELYVLMKMTDPKRKNDTAYRKAAKLPPEPMDPSKPKRLVQGVKR